LANRHLEDFDVIAERFETQITELCEVRLDAPEDTQERLRTSVSFA